MATVAQIAEHFNYVMRRVLDECITPLHMGLCNESLVIGAHANPCSLWKGPTPDMQLAYLAELDLGAIREGHLVR